MTTRRRSRRAEPCALALIPIPCFLLAAQSQDEHSFHSGHVLIPSNVTPRTLPDYQFTKVAADRPANQGIFFKNLKRFDNGSNALIRVGNLMLAKMFKNAVEVVVDFRCEFDSRHRGDSTRALGFAVFFPAARSTR